MKELGMNLEEYDWYLGLRKYGTCKRAGFGIGFERLLMYLTGMKNIRDVTAYPRTEGSCKFQIKSNKSMQIKNARVLVVKYSCIFYFKL